MPFWAVAQTETLRERTAQRYLEELHGFETYLPVTKVEARTVPLFPAYLFVRLGEFRWSIVDNAIGVIQLLRSGERPAQLRDSVVVDIKRMERGGIVRLPTKRGLQIGDRVQVLRGVFANHVGLYDGMCARDRQFVLLDLLGRKVRTEVASTDLKIMSS